MFTQLFTTGKLGLGLTEKLEKRDKRAQADFRAALIEAYNSQNPDHRKDFLWCPILKDWERQNTAAAAHLFADLHRQECMDAIFGPTNPPELFSPLNGMIVSTAVEEEFDSGFMNESEPKEYKIRIIDFDDAEIDHFITPGSSQTWRELDNTNVEFRSGFRPSARYLYFHNCVQLLRRKWKGRTLKKNRSERLWGAPGGYLPKSRLFALVEEMGHEYEQLLEGATEDRPDAAEEDREILLAVASDQVKASSLKALGDEEDEEDDDDDEAGEVA